MKKKGKEKLFIEHLSGTRNVTGFLTETSWPILTSPYEPCCQRLRNLPTQAAPTGRVGVYILVLRSRWESGHSFVPQTEAQRKWSWVDLPSSLFHTISPPSRLQFLKGFRTPSCLLCPPVLSSTFHLDWATPPEPQASQWSCCSCSRHLPRLSQP